MNIILLLIAGLLLQGAGTGAITGRLRGPDGAPMSRTRVTAVTLIDGQQSASEVSVLASLAQTDDAGNYRLENIAPGRYYIAAGPVDFPIYHPGVSAPTAATIVSVRAGQTTTGMDFVMTRMALPRLLGRLVREGNPTPPAGQRVSITEGGRTRAVFTAPDGSFEFTNMRPGNYAIGLIPPVPTIPQRVTIADKDVSIELRTPFTRDVSGDVVIEGGGPQPRFTLSFTSADFSADAAATGGSFTTTLTAGTYRVSPTGLPPGFTLKSVMAGTRDLLRNPMTVATTTPASEHITVTLDVSSPPPWHRVSGRVFGTGSSSSLMSVMLTELPVLLPGSLQPVLPGLSAAEASLDADGSFSFSQVLPGTYNVRMGWKPNTGAGFPQMVPLTVVVASRDITDIQITLPARDAITAGETPVRIVMENGGPMPRLGVRLSEGGGIVSLTATPDGVFNVALSEGEHPVTVDPMPAGYALKSATYGTSDLKANPIRVSGGHTEELRLTIGPDKPNAWVKVSGRIVGLDPGDEVSLFMTPVGLPGANATPIANPNYSGVVTAKTLELTLGVPGAMPVPLRADGTFEIPAVLQGNYHLSLSSRFTDLPAVYSRARPAGLETTTTIAVRDSDLTVELRIPPQKQIVGRVTVDNANPQPTLRFTLAGGTSPIIVYPAPQLGGVFRVKLPEGEYRMSVGGLPSGYSVRSMTFGASNVLTGPIKIAAGNTEDLNIAIAAQMLTNFRLSGRVVSAGTVTGRISISGQTQQDRVLAANGSFEFDRVIPDLYNAQISLGNFSGDISIAANAGGNVTALRFYPVAGRVESEGGGLPSDYSIEARNTSRDLPVMVSSTLTETGRSRLNADGSFTIVLTGGDQEIRVVDLPEGYELKSIRYGTRDVVNGALKINETDPLAELRITLGRKR